MTVQQILPIKTLCDNLLESMLINHLRGWPTIGQLAMDWKRSGLVNYHSIPFPFRCFLIGTGNIYLSVFENNFSWWKIQVMTQLTIFKELPICLRKWMQNYNSVSTDNLYQLKFSINLYMKMQKHAQSLCWAVCFLLPHLYTCPQSTGFIAFKTKRILKKLKKSSAADQLTTTCATLMNTMMDEVKSS